MKRWPLVIIAGVILLLIGFGVVHAVSKPLPPKTVQTASTPLTVSDINVTELYNLTNQAREQNGVTDLRLNPALTASSVAKCSDMVAQDYFAHNAPDGSTPWHFFTEAGVPNSHLGENLAEGLNTANNVMAGWLNSPGHKANILDPKFTDVGFGVCAAGNGVLGPNLMVVQHFAEY